MTEIIEKYLFENISHPHNKFYEVTIQETEKRYSVIGRYGKRTLPNWKEKGGTFQIKGDNMLLHNAQRMAKELIQAKKDKEYKQIDIPKPVKKPEEKTMEEYSLDRFSNLDF